MRLDEVRNPTDKPVNYEPFPADEETPDGLCGTPSERFTAAARRVFSLTPAQVADVKQATKPKPAPTKQARQKTA